MDLLIAANFSDNYTDVVEFPKVNESLFLNLYKDHVANFTKTSNLSQPESVFVFKNSSNFTESYWYDVNLTNDLLTDNFTNDKNDTSPVYDLSQLARTIAITFSLGSTTMATIVGNLFVIFAILMDRNLQTVGNYLVLSLAVADLMVALLVMPMGAIYEVYQEWILGPELCEIWTSGDVLCCTASILHLVAIAMDRYWAVTNVDYVRQRSSRRIGLMIFLVWAVGFLVSFAPILGWKDDNFLSRIEEEKRCLVSQDAAYQIFATCATFYVPLVIILILYWRIFQVARKRIRHKPGAKARTIQPSEKSMIHVVSHDNKSSPSTQITETTTSATNGTTATIETITPAKNNKKKPTRENMEAKRERKAAKTLAIITGVFVICWLPFFVTALLMAVCPACEPNPYLFSFFLWLGYANSMLNPIIYTIFSPDFRSAFQRVLCGKKRGRMR